MDTSCLTNALIRILKCGCYGGIWRAGALRVCFRLIHSTSLAEREHIVRHTVIPQGFRIAITARLIGEENSLAGAWR